MIKFRTINEKLIVLVSLTMIIITILANIYSWGNGLSRIEKEVSNSLAQEIEVVTGALEYPIWDLNYDVTNSIIEAVINQPSIIEITVTDQDGNFLAGVKKQSSSKNKYIQVKEILHDGRQIGFVELTMTDEYIKENFLQTRLIDLQLVLFQMFAVIAIIHFFMNKALLPLQELETVASNIADGHYKNPLLKRGSHQVKKLQDAVLKMQSALVNKEARITEQIAQLEVGVKNTNKAYKDTVLALAKSVEINDTYTGGHCERVAYLSKKIAQGLELDQETVNEIEIAAILHDIGKIGISPAVINKPGKLTDEEYGVIKTHSQKGYDILSNISFLNSVAQHVLMHHERLDGRGYPNGIKSDAISLGAKIISVADSYDAMTSKRSYRLKVMTMDEAIVELTKNTGTQFAPEVVEVFVKLLEGGVDIEYFEKN